MNEKEKYFINMLEKIDEGEDFILLGFKNNIGFLDKLKTGFLNGNEKYIRISGDCGYYSLTTFFENGNKSSISFGKSSTLISEDYANYKRHVIEAIWQHYKPAFLKERW